MDRIIVVIPFTSIIDQNAEVYMNALGFCNVLEHHSNIDLAKKKRMADEERKRRQEVDSPLNYFANENWDIPVIVTTNVQFFESLFSRKPSSCRKIHNIANSVIIFDEVQLFPLDYVEPIISVIKRLIEEYRCTAVFSTATQPAFGERFVKDGIKSQEIVPTPEGLAENLRRVKIHWPNSMKQTVSWKTLAKRILRVGKESMTIVNLKQDALDLSLTLKAMKREDHVFHLSAHMCPEHRREKIREIKEILERNKERKRIGDHKLETCRVVTTQLIEAGVDIDFPYVFRAMAGLDSIAQAAGRCNREGLLSMGHLWTFNPETLPPPGVLRSGLAITREMFSVHGRSLDPTNPVVQSSYFEKLYASQSLDKKDIGLKKRRRDFRQIHEDFKIISDETFVVLVPWGYKGNAMLLEVLNAKELEKRHLRAMQPYTVSVYKKVLDALLQKGHIAQLVVDDEEKIIWYVKDMSAYHEDYGLLV
jgi:CRISPR-associated endonuclease/helicase Cas3